MPALGAEAQMHLLLRRRGPLWGRPPWSRRSGSFRGWHSFFFLFPQGRGCLQMLCVDPQKERGFGSLATYSLGGNVKYGPKRPGMRPSLFSLTWCKGQRFSWPGGFPSLGGALWPLIFPWSPFVATDFPPSLPRVCCMQFWEGLRCKGK